MDTTKIATQPLSLHSIEIMTTFNGPSFLDIFGKVLSLLNEYP